MQNKIISIVVDGSGFLLRHVVQALIREGYNVRILSTTPREVMKVKLAADLGRIFIQTINFNNYDALHQALEGSCAVINLSGAADMSAQNLHSVNNELLLARASEDLGINNFIHFSYIDVDYAYGSDYACSQYEKEKFSMRECNNVIILRPAIIFGEHDNFISLVKRYLNFSTIVPLLNQHTGKLMPIYAGDVAKVIVLILKDPEKFHGKILELKGEQDYSMHSLIKEVAEILGKQITFIQLPYVIIWVMAMISKVFPPLLMIRMQVDLFAHNYHDNRQNRLTENKHFRITQLSLKDFLKH